MMKRKLIRQAMSYHLSVYSLFFLALILLYSCKNEAVDVEKVKENAVMEYVKKTEEARKQKLDVIEKFYSVFSTGNTESLPEILAKNYTQYPSDPGQTPDIEGFIKHAKDFGTMFSDLKGKHTHILVDGDYVHVRGEYDVTHSGDVFGITPTGKRITIIAFDTHHFNQEGKIDKTWHLEDFWGAYSQITSK